MAGPVESVDTSAMPWSRLWATGVLHSCATGIHGNYDGEVLAFWQGQFDLAGDGARILDVGTGNGALLLLARERATRRGIGLTLLGVDIADIEPGRAVAGGADRFAGIEFHPRTSVCALPFADGEIDEAAWVPVAQLRDWLPGHSVCPDSVALVLPRLDAP